MKKLTFQARRRLVILQAVAILLAALSALASSNLYAQTSFGKMRDASEKRKSAPVAENVDDDPFNVEPKADSKTSSKSNAKASNANKSSSDKTTLKQSAVKQVEDSPATDSDVASDLQPKESATSGQPASNQRQTSTAATTRRPNTRQSASTSSETKGVAVAGKPVGENGHGPLLGRAVSHKYRAGMIFQAQPGGTCVNVFGSAPVPMEFPEQKVRTLEEEFPKIAKVDYRELKEGGARQLLFKMRELRGGQGVEASALFEVTRYPIMPPTEKEIYSIPKTVPSDIRRYLKESKYMESSTKMIKELAKESAKECENDWEKVDNILSFVRDNIQYKEVLIEKPMRGAIAALRTREGDCEDMSALFISMCRALDIPARLVRVPGHCWAEFYLVDNEKQGFWFPAQVAGTEELGSLQDTRVILQKGDSFRLPESPKEEELYVKELFMGTVKDGGPDPKYQFIQETDGR